MVDKWLNYILSKYLPQPCAICGGPCNDPMASGLCRGCKQELPVLAECCLGCSNPLEDSHSLMSDRPWSQLVQTRYCGRCLASPPSYDHSISFFPYRSPFKQLVTALKFNATLSHARLLGQLFAEQLCMTLDETEFRPDVILPVPLHVTRLRQRGFNQSLEIARPISKQFDIPLQPMLVERQRATQPQSSLSLKQRKKNIKGAFTVTSPIDHKHVAIVDDVMTSGATVDALAATLKQHGVETVSVWCICRALPLSK